MKAGRLNKLIEFHHFLETKDTGGARVGGWTLFTRCWASVDENEQSQSTGQGIEQNAQRITVLMHYRSDINKNMRIRYNNHDYEIVSAISSDSNGLKITASYVDRS